MTDPNVPATDESATQMNPEIDPFLATLVLTVEAFSAIAGREGAGADASMELSVTLIVGGAVTKGDITAGRKWWAMYEEGLRSATGAPGTNPEMLTAMAQTMADTTHTMWEPVYLTEEPRSIDQIGYVHLTNARVIPGLESGLLMRVKLKEVQGWSFGR
jgi:hypothetical protein